MPRLAPRDAGATVGAGAEVEEELQTNPAVAAMGVPADTDDLIPSPDILAPPLSQPQQDQLYSFSIEDYKQHLSDLLRLRVLAAILFVRAHTRCHCSRSLQAAFFSFCICFSHVLSLLLLAVVELSVGEHLFLSGQLARSSCLSLPDVFVDRRDPRQLSR